MKIKPEPVILALAAAGAVAFLAAGLRKSGGLPLVQKAAATTESSWNINDTVAAVLCLPDEHAGDVVFTKHRYPDRIGGELTTVMHYGHSALSVPDVTDKNWITAPPSEVTL